MGSVASVCVSMSVCPVLCKVLTYKLHFCHADILTKYLCQVPISRSSGQGQGHRSKNSVYDRN